MPRKKTELLSAVQIKSLRPGFHFDGGVPGLAIKVAEPGKEGKPGARSWVLRAMVGGKRRDIGLGGFPEVGQADARRLAREARESIGRGVDPVEAKRTARSTAAADRERAKTFDQAAEDYIAVHEPSWRNRKHAQQWRNTLKTYASPHFGSMLVRDIGTEHIKAALLPIWYPKIETAKRLRGRIEAILGACIAMGLRPEPNPASWKGRLDNVFPSPKQVRKAVHYPAVRNGEAAAFAHRLRAIPGMAARCLEFGLLTAARSGEARKATWNEVDLDAALWTVPAAKMKMGRPHFVALSPAAVALLKAQPRIEGEALVFPGRKVGKPLSDMALSVLMKRMGVMGIDGDGNVKPAVPHGLRTTFRVWVSECTEYKESLADAALSHAKGDPVESAYNRTDYLEQRRPMMADWAAFLAKEASAKAQSAASATRVEEPA